MKRPVAAAAVMPTGMACRNINGTDTSASENCCPITTQCASDIDFVSRSGNSNNSHHDGGKTHQYCGGNAADSSNRIIQTGLRR